MQNFNSYPAESARGSDSEDEVLRMKRKNAIASDSEADSDTEMPKGAPFSSIFLCAVNCYIPRPEHLPQAGGPAERCGKAGVTKTLYRFRKLLMLIVCL